MAGAEFFWRNSCNIMKPPGTVKLQDFLVETNGCFTTDVSFILKQNGGGSDGTANE
jgi:hypothetical protein